MRHFSPRSLPAVDFEHAHAPFPGSVPVSLSLDIECVSADEVATMQVAVRNLVPVEWSWRVADDCVCLRGTALAHLPAGSEWAAERQLEAVLDPFAQCAIAIAMAAGQA